MLKAVFLDIDGTLVDSNELHVLAWQQAFQDAGFPLTARAIARQIGKGADQLIPSLCPGLGDHERKVLTQAHDAAFQNDYLPHVVDFAGASALLRGLHDAHLTVILASSARKAEVDHYVRLLRVQHAVSALVTGDDVERSKPEADIFKVALGKCGCKAEEAIVIGDTPWDVIAASRSGLASIGVLSGGFSAHELQGAVAVFDGVWDINALGTRPVGAKQAPVVLELAGMLGGMDKSKR